MAGVLDRAGRDLADHQLWRARRRLEGFVGSQGYDRDVLELLGEVCDRMGDLPAAGRFWFFCESKGAERLTAVEQFVRDCGGDPLVIFSRLPRKLRDTRLDRFPTEVQRRLKALLAARPKRSSRSIGERPRRRLPRSLSADLLAFGVLGMIALFCLYCFLVGFAHLFRIR